MQDEIEVQCPWCHQWGTVVVSVDDSDTWVEDCEVCCRPWVVRVSRAYGDDGPAWVEVDRGNE
jgi:hypothetical protein